MEREKRPGKHQGFLIILHEVALIYALKIRGGNLTHAARYLGISIRTARNWMRKYRLEVRFDREPPAIMKDGREV